MPRLERTIVEIYYIMTFLKLQRCVKTLVGILFVFLVPLTSLAQNNSEYDIEEISYFLAAILKMPQGTENWISCLFWFIAVVVFGYILGALGVVAVSDTNARKRTIYLRQIGVFTTGSLIAMLVTSRYELTCLIIPFALLTLGLFILGLWYFISNVERDASISKEDIEL